MTPFSPEALPDPALLVAGLNQEQKNAVTAPAGPVLIYAGAGTGKTRVLTHRIAWLIATGQVAPYQICAVTFTNKAAREMRTRVEALLGQNTSGMWLGTFHSFGAKLLREYDHHDLVGRHRGFTIYDGDAQSKLVERQASLLGINLKELGLSPSIVRERISRLKDDLLEPGASLDLAANYNDQVIARIYRGYEVDLQAANAFDFGDLIKKPCNIFQAHPDVLEAYQHRYQWLLVDEYQDTNHAQYYLIQALARLSRNLTVVGDDSQSVYAFRGADIRNILSFRTDYPDAFVVTLEQNYRSHQAILDISTAVISHNDSYIEKKLWSSRKVGEAVRLFSTYDANGEAQVVATEIEDLLGTQNPETGDKVGYDDIAVLYRVHALSRAMEQALARRRIPYRIVGGLRFFDRAEIKDILAYLRILSNPFDVDAFTRAIAAPARGIGLKTVEAILTASRTSQRSLVDLTKNPSEIPGLNRTKQNGIAAFGSLLDSLQNDATEIRLSQLVNQILAVTDYRKYVNTRLKEPEPRQENLDELLNLATEWDTLETAEAIEAMLENAALTSATDADDADLVHGAVTLTTVHAVKGLEFQATFLIGLEEGIFPHSRSQTDAEIEEERRLAYVALTRAKHRLYLSWVHHRSMYGNSSPYGAVLSRFIGEIPEEYLQPHPVPRHLGLNDVNPGGYPKSSASRRWNQGPIYDGEWEPL